MVSSLDDSVFDQMEKGEFTIRKETIFDIKTHQATELWTVLSSSRQTVFDFVKPQQTPTTTYQYHAPVPRMFANPPGNLPPPDIGFKHVFKERDGMRVCIIELPEPVPPKPPDPPETPVVKLPLHLEPKPLPNGHAPKLRVVPPIVPKTDRIGREWIAMVACLAITAVALWMSPLAFVAGAPVGIAYGLWQHCYAPKKKVNHLLNFTVSGVTVAGSLFLPSTFYLAPIASAFAGMHFASLLCRTVTRILNR